MLPKDRSKMNDNLSLSEAIDKLTKEPLDQLKKSLMTFDRDLAKDSIDKIIAEKIDPNTVLEVVTTTMRVVGDAFAREEIFLPELFAAADTMQTVMPDIEKEIEKKGSNRKDIGKVVLGTVRGDIHSIGKTMVGTLMTAGGFKVYDLGIDVSSKKFMEAIRENKPDILALSALLTTTAYEQENVINMLKKEGLREKVKIIVGGGAVTQEFADSIGADGYESSAPGAAELAKELLGIKED
jgi:5-methyltetrahydrofolate--homocysteine methyltransferase